MAAAEDPSTKRGGPCPAGVSEAHQKAIAQAPYEAKPYEFLGFGAMDVTKPYEFIGFGAMDVTRPYEFIGLGAMDVTKPYGFI